MVDWPAVLLVLTIYIPGVILPGPNMIAVSHWAISVSRKHALMLVAGIVLVNIFWATSAILGLGAIFKLFPWAALLVKSVGALYLVWFGIRLIRNSKNELAKGKEPASKSLRSAFFNGVSVNLANPKSIAFYAAVFSAAAPEQVSFLTLLAMLAVVVTIASLWYGSVAIVFSKTQVSNAFQKVKVYFDRACGTVIIVLGLKQALATSSL
jgi:threonine efflux protein